jgi:hypothetical protein
MTRVTRDRPPLSDASVASDARTRPFLVGLARPGVASGVAKGVAKEAPKGFRYTSQCASDLGGCSECSECCNTRYLFHLDISERPRETSRKATTCVAGGVAEELRSLATSATPATPEPLRQAQTTVERRND